MLSPSIFKCLRKRNPKKWKTGRTFYFQAKGGAGVGAASRWTSDKSRVSVRSNRRKRPGVLGKGVLALAVAGCVALEKFKQGLSVENALGFLEEAEGGVNWAEVRAAAARANMCLSDAAEIMEYHQSHPDYSHCESPHFEDKDDSSPIFISNLDDLASRYFLYTTRNRVTGRVEQHLAIKGSTCAKNWQVNASANKVWDAELKVHLHSGFKKVADAVVEELMESRQKLLPDASLHFSGHSQGGAIATIVAAKLKLRGYGVARIITFGAPGFTTSQGADVLSSMALPLLRVDNHFDIIPYLSLGYKHFGDHLLLLKGHSCSSCEEVVKGTQCQSCLEQCSKHEIPQATSERMGETEGVLGLQKHFAYLPAEKISSPQLWWTTSLLVNFTLRNLGSHRMGEYEKEVEGRLTAATPVPLTYRYKRNLWM
mmetsp:Transcript_27645/g.36271  ORF Transcript_27645/g.36271 Transcript_27645/m.36271 type:complete len:426 (-) Transcript_27645:394-1671(-)